MVMTSSAATRYCLPPVLMTAYMAFPSRYPRPMAPQLPADFGDRRKDGDASLGQRILRARLKGRTRSGGFIASTRQIVNPRQTLPGFDPGQRQRRNCLRISAQPGRLRWRLSDAEPLRTVGIGRATHFRHETLGRRSYPSAAFFLSGRRAPAHRAPMQSRRGMCTLPTRRSSASRSSAWRRQV